MMDGIPLHHTPLIREINLNLFLMKGLLIVMEREIVKQELKN